MIEFIESFLELEKGLLALVVGSSRAMAFILVLPLFNRFGIQAGLIRGGVLLALSAPVAPSVYGDLIAGDGLEITTFVALVVKELGIGLVLGLLLGLPFWAVSAAGDIIDFQRGASMATIVDPGSGDETTPSGTLFFLLAAYLLVTNGWFLEVFLQTFYDSYAAWPVLTLYPEFADEAASRALGILASISQVGLVLAIPIIGPLLLIEIAMAVAFKYTAQINVMILAMSFKQVIYIVLLPLYFVSLMYFTSNEVFLSTDADASLDGFFRPNEALNE